MPWEVDDESCENCLASYDGEPVAGDWNGWKGWFRWRRRHGTWSKWHLSDDEETTACDHEIKEPELEVATRSSAPGGRSTCSRCQSSNEPSQTSSRRSGRGNNPPELPFGTLWDLAKFLFRIFVR